MRLIDADYLKEIINEKPNMTFKEMVDCCPTQSIYSEKPIEVFNKLIGAPNKDGLCELIEYLEVWKNHYKSV